MFAEKIKEATLTNHQQVEKILVTKMKQMRSKEDYAALLQMFYSYFGALEKKLNQFINNDNLPDHAQRRKTEALESDLNAVGADKTTMASEAELPVIGNAQQAFGALYVIEGSTLGGSIIAGMMKQYFVFDGDAGLSFFNGYGGQTMAMWQAFKQSLNHAAVSVADEEMIIGAANQTFACFKNWIER